MNLERLSTCVSAAWMIALCAVVVSAGVLLRYPMTERTGALPCGRTSESHGSRLSGVLFCNASLLNESAQAQDEQSSIVSLRRIPNGGTKT